MIRSILDQNGIISLRDMNDLNDIILSPMFLWELFRNINNSYTEPKLLECLQKFADRILITYRNTTLLNREIAQKRKLSFEEIIDLANTEKFRECIKKNPLTISHLRDIFSPSFDQNSFDKLNTHSLNWKPILKSQFEKLTSKQREINLIGFKNKSPIITKTIFVQTIEGCNGALQKKGYSDPEIKGFLKSPSILYNEVFCGFCILLFRSTKITPSPKDIINDPKDSNLLFFAHYADTIISTEYFVQYTFAHLKESHKFLVNFEEILKSASVPLSN